MEKPQPYVLFCEDPLNVNKVDPDFQREFECAKANGFEIILFNFDALTSNDNPQSSTKRIKSNEGVATAIYRGWMLTPNQYYILYQNLLLKNYKLINTVIEYQNCHYLPDSLKFIEAKTPHTIFEKLTNPSSIDTLIRKAKVLGNKPVIIKDFVKSEKHYWETAYFVYDVSDTEKLKQTINNFIQLRSSYLNEGIVIREFLELNDLAIHSKSGMPLKEEYRLFFCKNNLIGIYDYWEEGEYHLSKPDMREFEIVARNIESNFFTMDIARKKNGELVIIELGDGQVSGLPDRVDKNEFYEKLRNVNSSYKP
jgi:hypothetical protein